MRCFYFRPLFKYFEALRVHSDMILFLMNEKKLDVLSDVMCYFNWHKYNYNMKTF